MSTSAAVCQASVTRPVGSWLAVKVASIAAVGASASNAPMSQAGPCGRRTVRWSSATVPPLQSPLFSASLPARRAWVAVVPGALRASGPRLALPLGMSLGPVRLQVLSLSRLKSLLVGGMP